MRTDDLIDLLARGAGAAPRAVAARRLWPVALGGVVVAAALALALPGYADLDAVGAALWLKLGYGAALAAAAGWLAARLARPLASRAGAAALALALVVAAMAALGFASWWQQAPAQRLDYLLGHSWAFCPWAVFGLSLPALAAALHALRALAPTRPVAAGAACGAFAGALAAIGYALACSETSSAFVALWYTLGVALSAAAGALLGPRVLRW